MKTISTLCLLTAAGILVTACAAETSTDNNGGEAMQQVYSTGSNIPRHAPAGHDGVATMDRDAAGRVFTDPQNMPQLPPPPGGAR